MGRAFRGAGDALRRSVELVPVNSFLDIWLAPQQDRADRNGKKDRSIVSDEGAQAAGHLLTMAIAPSVCPPTDITFSDYLSVC
jgi:hypothetical protein